MSDGARIRAAQAGDLEAILHVAQGCVEAPQWSDVAWRQVLAENGTGLHCVQVAESGGRLVGFVAIGGVAGVAELENVAVAVEARRQGVGRALCHEAMQYAASQGATAMELEVRVSSAGARRLYAQLGFVEQGMRKDYYRQPAEDAVLMKATLAPGP